jgi:hypothetical protein
MASKFNTEFNYRYQVIGNTPWEKIKTLKGFLEGRVRTATLEEVSRIKFQKSSTLLQSQQGLKGIQMKKCLKLMLQMNLQSILAGKYKQK